MKDTDLKINLWFADFLQSIALEKPAQKLFIEMIKDELLKQSGKSELGPKHYEKVKNIEDKLVRLQDLYIEGNIEKSERKIAKERYETIHHELKSNEIELKDKKRVIEIYKSALFDI